MVAITTRNDKGSALTHQELDANFLLPAVGEGRTISHALTKTGFTYHPGFMNNTLSFGAVSGRISYTGAGANSGARALTVTGATNGTICWMRTYGASGRTFAFSSTGDGCYLGQLHVQNHTPTYVSSTNDTIVNHGQSFTIHTNSATETKWHGPFIVPNSSSTVTLTASSANSSAIAVSYIDL